MLHRILSLGAGVQSTTLYLLAMEQKLSIDCAIFADTGEEPSPVYTHLTWLESLGGPPIMRRSLTTKSLGDNLLKGVNGDGQRFVSIPAYTKNPGDKRRGQIRRQCTSEYKTKVIERTIRREILGLNPRQRAPIGKTIHFIGLSADEGARAVRFKTRFDKDVKWSRVEFPLIDMGWSRTTCKEYLKDRVPHDVPRSACTFCPYRRNSEWRWLRDNDPKGFDRACEIDHSLRVPGIVANRGMDRLMFVHESCVPLADVDFSSNETLDGFKSECHGVCGV